MATRVITGDVKQLKKLGFNWPRDGLHKKPYGPRAPRLLAAAAALPVTLTDLAGPLKRMYEGGFGMAQANLPS